MNYVALRMLIVIFTASGVGLLMEIMNSFSVAIINYLVDRSITEILQDILKCLTFLYEQLGHILLRIGYVREFVRFSAFALTILTGLYF